MLRFASSNTIALLLIPPPFPLPQRFDLDAMFHTDNGQGVARKVDA